MSDHPNAKIVNEMTAAIVGQDHDALAKIFTDDMMFHLRGPDPMVTSARDEVVGLQQRFRRQTLDVLVLRRIENAIAVAAGADGAGETKLCKMLRHRRRTRSHVSRQLGDGVFAVQEGPDDRQSRRVGEQLQRLSRCRELIARRLLNYMRRHVDSLPCESRDAGRLTHADIGI